MGAEDRGRCSLAVCVTRFGSRVSAASPALAVGKAVDGMRWSDLFFMSSEACFGVALSKAIDCIFGKPHTFWRSTEASGT